MQLNLLWEEFCYREFCRWKNFLKVLVHISGTKQCFILQHRQRISGKHHWLWVNKKRGKINQYRGHEDAWELGANSLNTTYSGRTIFEDEEAMVSAPQKQSHIPDASSALSALVQVEIWSKTCSSSPSRSSRIIFDLKRIPSLSSKTFSFLCPLGLCCCTVGMKCL